MFTKKRIEFELLLKQIIEKSLVNIINLLLYLDLMGFIDRDSVHPIRLNGLIWN